MWTSPIQYKQLLLCSIEWTVVIIVKGENTNIGAKLEWWLMIVLEFLIQKTHKQKESHSNKYDNYNKRLLCTLYYKPINCEAPQMKGINWKSSKPQTPWLPAGSIRYVDCSLRTNSIYLIQ